MITYFQGNQHTPAHPDTAADLLRELAAMLRLRRENLSRDQASADRLDGLAEVTPGDINGWALITYLRLAGAQPPNGTGLEELANRLQCLAELHVLAMLSTAHEHAMLATFLRERAALQACARVAR